MWCRVTRSTCSRSESRISRPRANGPHSRSNAPRLSSTTSRCNAPSGSGSPSRSCSSSANPEVRGGDPLHRPTVYGGEGGSQRLVPGDEAIQRPLHGGAVEVALQSQPERDVIGLADALELRQEPQPLL